MIDNYDSFTYNLVQYFGELGEDVHVFRNDKISIEEIAERAPKRIVISPGPCTPNEAGISLDVIDNLRIKFQSLGFAWVIRVSVRLSVVVSYMPIRSCTARPRKFTMIIPMCLKTWKSPSRQHATIPL